MLRKICVGVCAAALTISGIALVSGPAGAAAGPPKPKGKTACSTITGTVAGNISISGCLDSGGANTGGATVPFPTLNLATGGVITWLSGKTTTLAPPTPVPTNAKKCPGYVKPPKGGPVPPEPTALKVGGAVTADTSGMKIPGKVKGAICLAADGQTITLLKTFKIS